MASASCIIPNTDISGIGVRTATYAQNILSFVPAFLALLDKKVSNEELDSLRGQSTTILLSAFALLIAAFIQAQNHANGLDNYHTTMTSPKVANGEAKRDDVAKHYQTTAVTRSTASFWAGERVEPMFLRSPSAMEHTKNRESGPIPPFVAI
ncbi:hypothetical protein B0H16DRAFT_1690602 [Mycena metata]|uniref:Uncharacterized protein n=1 Tax=Mycena metata TaxID=1033252 RepID=A0AAD7J161_9AGAR|nr:hypothetical protein B0H16DRAFT_1690602 [Mycena metata]